MKTYLTSNAKQTRILGSQVAKKLVGGEILALSGPLGSGKTEFVKGVAKALNIKTVITSPTFIILKSYRFKKGRSSLYFLHFDLYRIKTASELESLGFTELLNNKKAIAVIEWPEKIWRLLPQKTYKLFFVHGKQTNRRIIKIPIQLLPRERKST
jgi:tRNA threonylcarbamoyladenosine biosynthesis protein TsaE